MVEEKRTGWGKYENLNFEMQISLLVEIIAKVGRFDFQND